MLFYGTKLPRNNDIVFVTITSFTNNGTYCKLIEYNDVEGFIPNTELDRKVLSPMKIFRIGSTYPMAVMSVMIVITMADATNSNGFAEIDLSYRKVSPDTRADLLNRFMTVQKIYSLTNDIVHITKLPEEIVFALTMWKLSSLKDTKKIDAIFYDNFLEDIGQYVKFLETQHPIETKIFVDNFNSRLSVTQPVFSQDIELVITGENAIDTIKNILNHEDVTIKHISAPKYRITADSTEKIKECIYGITKKLQIAPSGVCKMIKVLDEINVVKKKEYFVKPLNKN